MDLLCPQRGIPTVAAYAQKDRPIVDVLIPVFNGAPYLLAAINSILNQTVRDISVVIVDDGSVDETPRILRELANADPRIKIITKPNTGIVDTLNAGLEHCRAEYLARFDADDISFPPARVPVGPSPPSPRACPVDAGVEHIDELGRPLFGLPGAGPENAGAFERKSEGGSVAPDRDIRPAIDCGPVDGSLGAHAAVSLSGDCGASPVAPRRQQVDDVKARRGATRMVADGAKGFRRVTGSFRVSGPAEAL